MKLEINHLRRDLYQVLLRGESSDTVDNILVDVEINADEALWPIIEVMVRYDIAVYSGELPKAIQFDRNTYRAIDVGMEKPGFITASVCNGDTGEMVKADGRSVLDAMAAVVRATGFKSVIETGEITLTEYLRDYTYGLKRLSDERLALEMESIIAPNKGAW